MMTLKPEKRTDIHRPSKIQTDEYECLGFIYIGPDPFATLTFADERRAIWDCIDRNGYKYSKHTHGGTCSVCGAYAHYLGVFLHVPTGTVIRAGQECAEKIMDNDMDGFDAIKVRAKAAKERGIKLQNAREWSKANGLACMECVANTNTIVSNMWNSLRNYGSLTDKQVDFAKKLIHEAKNPVEKVEEPKPTKAAPTGRVDVTGEVLCTKLQEGYYDTTLKMLVRSDDGGWKLWVTVPSSLLDAHVEGGLRGTKVSMKVTVTPSDTDEFFSFGKRPAKAKVIGE